MGLWAAGEFASATNQILGYEVEGAFQGGDRGTGDIVAWMASRASEPVPLSGWQSPAMARAGLISPWSLAGGRSFERQEST